MDKLNWSKAIIILLITVVVIFVIPQTILFYLYSIYPSRSDLTSVFASKLLFYIVTLVLSFYFYNSKETALKYIYRSAILFVGISTFFFIGKLLDPYNHGLVAEASYFYKIIQLDAISFSPFILLIPLSFWFLIISIWSYLLVNLFQKNNLKFVIPGLLIFSFVFLYYGVNSDYSGYPDKTYSRIEGDFNSLIKSSNLNSDKCEIKYKELHDVEVKLRPNWNTAKNILNKCYTKLALLTCNPAFCNKVGEYHYGFEINQNFCKEMFNYKSSIIEKNGCGSLLKTSSREKFSECKKLLSNEVSKENCPNGDNKNYLLQQIEFKD